MPKRKSKIINISDFSFVSMCRISVRAFMIRNKSVNLRLVISHRIQFLFLRLEEINILTWCVGLVNGGIIILPCNDRMLYR
ncbi:MAG: hypothetical protein CMF65_02295 [Magnetovibrio sp.]|nr:hypothetical protein [Magnetovibrio sp.]